MTGKRVRIGGLWVQVSVVQFSNDVRVELAPQRMGMEQLRVQLGDMVRTNKSVDQRWLQAKWQAWECVSVMTRALPSWSRQNAGRQPVCLGLPCPLLYVGLFVIALERLQLGYGNAPSLITIMRQLHMPSSTGHLRRRA